MKQWWKQKNRR